MYILCLSCEDKPGIVAAVAIALKDSGCNIEESSQFFDHPSGKFFMRVVFDPQNADSISAFEQNFTSVVKTYAMEWQISKKDEKVRTMIMVSKFDHCLNDLLYRWRTGILPIDITAVISNHEDTRELVEVHNLPFHFLPVTKETKAKQEDQVSEIIRKTNSDLVIMARYMQILSEDFCDNFSGHVINIHHSFLPGFKGAKPYHQAYDRGVKIIGATAHFATADLDEGPIITQEVTPVDHTHTPEKMRLMGQDIENRVLARAIECYAERRIFVHGPRTIIL